MKLVPIIAALAVATPVTANAQSLTDTHVLVWHPSGKTPAATYRPRAKPACAKRFDDHRAGKGQFHRAPHCPVDASPATSPIE